MKLSDLNPFKKAAENYPRQSVSRGVSLAGGQTPSSLSNMNAYGSVGWLFAAVNRISHATGSVNWKLYRRDANGERTEVHAHPLLDVWRRPCPFYTRETFVETIQQHIDLTGEAFWLITKGQTPGGPSLEFWPLRPDRVTVVAHPTDYIAGYLYKLGSEQTMYAPDDVVHIRMPNPNDPYRGLGPVQSLIHDLGTEKKAAQWTEKFFDNSAQPGGVIQFDEFMQDADFEKLVARLKYQHQGIGNAHRVMVIEAGEWKDVKLSQRDMQLEQLRRLNRDIILGAFGMPAALLGVSESVNRANAEAAEVMFGRWVLTPRLRRIRGSLNVFTRKTDPSLEWDFEDPTPDDRQQALLESTQLYTGGVITLNESRDLMGYGEVEGGDEFQAPPAPIDPFALTISGLKDVSTNGHKVIPAEAQPPPIPYPEPSSGVLRETSGNFGGSFGGIPETFGGISETRDAQSSNERSLYRGWAMRLRQERDSIIEFFEEEDRTQALVSGVETKLPEISDVEGYDWDFVAKYSDEVEIELSSAFEASLLEAGADIPREELTRLAAQYAKERSASLLSLDGPHSIAESIRSRVRGLIAQSIEEKRTPQELARALRKDFSFSKSRASTIARTETATALGEGQFRIAKAQDLDQKRWVTQGDQLVEEDCLRNERAGWISAIQPFPTGHKTIPLHPNCRCTVLYRMSVEEPVESSLIEG